MSVAQLNNLNALTGYLNWDGATKTYKPVITQCADFHILNPLNSTCVSDPEASIPYTSNILAIDNTYNNTPIAIPNFPEYDNNYKMQASMVLTEPWDSQQFNNAGEIRITYESQAGTQVIWDGDGVLTDEEHYRLKNLPNNGNLVIRNFSNQLVNIKLVWYLTVRKEVCFKSPDSDLRNVIALDVYFEHGNLDVFGNPGNGDYERFYHDENLLMNESRQGVRALIGKNQCKSVYFLFNDSYGYDVGIIKEFGFSENWELLLNANGYSMQTLPSYIELVTDIYGDSSLIRAPLNEDTNWVFTEMMKANNPTYSEMPSNGDINVRPGKKDYDTPIEISSYDYNMGYLIPTISPEARRFGIDLNHSLDYVEPENCYDSGFGYWAPYPYAEYCSGKRYIHKLELGLAPGF